MIFFPHIPKAGGTTLKRMFFQVFGRKNCIKVWNTATADVNPSLFHQYEISINENDERCVVLGHLSVSEFLSNPICFQKYKKGEVKIITSVREPIERIISQYNYITSNVSHPKNSIVKDIGYERYLLNASANLQTKFLSFEKELVDLKAYSLECSVVGFKQEIQEYSGISVDIPEIANATVEISGGKLLLEKSMLDSSLISILESKHSKDVELYNSLL